MYSEWLTAPNYISCHEEAFEKKPLAGEGSDAIANGRCYFQMAIACQMTTGRHGEGRDFSDLRPLVLSQLYTTHDHLLLLKRPRELCTKVPKQFACRAHIHPPNASSLSLVGSWLGASLTLRLDYCYI